MIYLDTNIIMRYLLDDNIELSLKAKEIIDSETNLYICDGVCAEINFGRLGSVLAGCIC